MIEDWGVLFAASVNVTLAPSLDCVGNTVSNQKHPTFRCVPAGLP